MSINQLLADEQITLIQHAAETDPVQAKKLRRRLGVFKRMLAGEPYSHRPYVPKNKVEMHLGTGKAAMPATGYSSENGIGLIRNG